MEKYFSKEEIEVIMGNDKIKDYKKNTLDIKVDEIFKYLSTKNMNKKEITKIIIKFPRLITYSIENISSNCEYLDITFDKKTNRIVKSNPRILSRNIEYIENRIKYLTNIFKEEKIVKKICIKFPTILTLSELNIEISIKNLEELINDKNKIISLISSNPNILSFSNKLINQKIKWFYDKGYNKKEIMKIIIKAPTVLTIDYETKESNIDKKYNYLFYELNYTKEEIIDITSKFPIYYTLGLDTIKNRVENLIRLGYNIDTIKTIIYKFPPIISLKENTINKKYNYLKEIDIVEVFTQKPFYLMQSLELTKARYEYLINKELEVNKTNYSKLFLSSKKFKNSYGIDNEKLLKNYKEEKFEQQNNKTNKCKKRIKQINNDL